MKEFKNQGKGQIPDFLNHKNKGDYQRYTALEVS
jgi:hypothetical protein